ncbi:flagellar FlbD family protein [Bacillus toyonensis]|uniref:flagellar FlbD family protein n=1 Tax=Bacillus toyonensis TaxID=155322 RepID=UPI002E22FB8A|nr:flagellar FlbD family protein [Bacillus toyonensis]
MIYLTKSDSTKYLLNHNKIISIEKSLVGVNLLMEGGHTFTVIETEDEIKKLIERYKVNIIKAAIIEAKRCVENE